MRFLAKVYKKMIVESIKKYKNVCIFFGIVVKKYFIFKKL